MSDYQQSKEMEKEKSIEEKSEIRELEKRIELLEARLENEKEQEEKEAIVKQEIRNYLQELQTPKFVSPISVRNEAEEIAKFPLSQQVSSLISLVLEKGLDEAISIAKALDNPAVLDEFHDVLVDRYYDELVKKKILKSKN